MVRFGKWVVAGLTICMLALPQAKAVGFQPVSPDELKMTSEPLAPGAAAIILYRQVDRDDGRTAHENDYIRIKILTEEGRKYANVEIEFVKEFQDIVNVKGRTIKPDGSIVDFDGKVFEKELVKTRGRKILAKTFTLPDVQVGGIIEYFYTVDYTEHLIFDSHWILSDELFTRKAQFSLNPYMGNGYVVYTVRWSWQGLPAGTLPPKEGGDHIIRMESSNIPAFETEDYMPPPNELKSRVDFIYQVGISERDQDNYWRQLGKTRNGQLESFIGKQKAMQEAVAQIVSPADPPEVKLRKIYDRVQMIRNTTYELRKTEQEEKREKEKPAENVEEVWKRGYGNGFQLTWLFLALARAAGFEAYGCWVSGRSEYFFTPVTLQGSKLNANVVLVKLNGQDVYFDPGAAFTPFGMLTWSETGVQGLRLDKDGGTWIKTTIPHAAESRIEHVAKLKLSDTGDLEGTLTVTYVGLEALYQRVEERHADDVERKKFLEERVTSQIAFASQAELTNKPAWTSSETPLVAEFTLKIPGFASNAGKRVVLPAAIFTAGEKGVFEHASRVHPIYVEYPYEKVDDVTIELPAGWHVSNVPPPPTPQGGAIIYTLQVDPGPGSLRLRRTLGIDFLLLDPKYYATLRNFFQVVRTNDGSQIVVQPGEIHASN
jgi:hypothetical protein